MNKYRAEYFSTVDWEWLIAEILADSEEQARECIDRACKPEFRMKSYADERKDTLKLSIIESDLKLPLVFRSYY